MLIENKDEIKEANDIFNVVASYVKLEKRGRYYLGLCPFHKEKTPSFNVNQETQSFYCFGCHAGGDVISFIQLIEGLSFTEAMEKLAERAGLPIKLLEGSTSSTPQYQDILECLKVVANFYHYCLTKKEAGKEAADYLTKRGISRESIKKYGLGYAPLKWKGLHRYFSNDKLPEDSLENAGLIIKAQSGNSYYDRFRGRIIFPICNRQGQVVGFGGRSIAEDIMPKYLNSPETAIFKKSKLLYGQNWAKKQIRELGYAIVVEGYMDALSMYQAGILNVVASLGTSFTKDHAQALLYDCKKCYLAFDGDNAGQAATIRGMKILQECGLGVYIVELPSGLDPDDVIKNFGSQWFAQAVEQAKNIYEYLIGHATMGINLDNSADLTNALNNCFAAISNVTTSVERNHYLSSISETLRLREQDVRIDFQRYLMNPKEYDKQKTDYDIKIEKNDSWKIVEKRLIKSLFMQKNETDLPIDIASPDIFTSLDIYEIYVNALKLKRLNKRLVLDELKEALEKDYQKNYLSLIEFEGFSDNDGEQYPYEVLINKMELESICSKIEKLQALLQEKKANQDVLGEISLLQKKRIYLLNATEDSFKEE
jgi:DNA primase